MCKKRGLDSQSQGRRLSGLPTRWCVVTRSSCDGHVISVGSSLAQGHWDVFRWGVSWTAPCERGRSIGSDQVWSGPTGVGVVGEYDGNGLIMCGPRDLVSPRPWDSHLTLALAFTLNALGIVLGSVGIGYMWIGESYEGR